MSRISDDLRAALDVADARLKGGDNFDAFRRIEEAREVLAATVDAVLALDERLDQIAD